MDLIYIDEKYTDYLRTVDNRVSYNKNKTYQRPYMGVLLNFQNLKYFAPLTSSSKGKKLKDFPKEENTTFFPILNCQFGGINFNNMIPVIDGVFWLVDAKFNANDSSYERKEKIKFNTILRFLRKNEDYIILKAKKLYNFQIKGDLFENHKAITCDFKKLEERAKKYI